jgi:hypothetical protein
MSPKRNLGSSCLSLDWIPLQSLMTTILENEEANPPLGSRKNEERKYKNDKAGNVKVIFTESVISEKQSK